MQHKLNVEKLHVYALIIGGGGGGGGGGEKGLIYK